jgi:hypothetical protein
MFFRLKKRWAYYGLGVAQRPVLRTPPIVLGNGGGPILISQLCHRDVLMYLVAVKSFVRFLPAYRVCIVNDGSLDEGDRDVLRTHIPGIEIFDAKDFRSERYPKGGCWERLAALIRFCGEGYVMQLDADTVTLNVPQEVCDSVSAKTPFTLGTEQGPKIVAASEAAVLAEQFRSEGDEHVQTLAELALGEFSDMPGLRYVRGCAAFTGIPEKALELDDIESWAERFEAIMGSRWREWGTEQFMSNFLIANLADTRVLTWPHYAGCSHAIHPEQVFVHFLGYCRFKGLRYHRLSREMIGVLGGGKG